MWHASAGAMGATDDQLIAWATRMLAGVGDAGAGQWVQVNAAANGIRVCHLRRRLAKSEVRRVGDVRDVRGTPEHLRRGQVTAAALALPLQQVMALN